MGANPGQKRILLLIAALLLLVALLWGWVLNRGTGASYARYINGFGYHVLNSDVYAAADWENTSIRELLPNMELDGAVRASRQIGLNGDIDRAGRVTLLLIHTEQDEVITIYTLDGEIELAFVQTAGQTGAYALGAEEPE